MKICLVCSSGGHLAQLHMLEKCWKKHEHFWVTFDKEDANSLLKDERKYYCYYPSNRSIKALIINTRIAIKVLRKEKPDVVISTGAAPAVPFFFIAKLFRIKTIYIEIYDRINTSTLSGRLCYKVADKFIVQWEELKEIYPKAICLGSIY